MSGAVPAAQPRAQRPLLGVALIIGGASCFATMDSLVHHLGGRVPVPAMLWLRYAIQAGAMLPLLLWLHGARRRAFATAHPRFQLLRGLLLLCSSAMSFIGLQFLPVAEFTAITMLTPVLVTLLAALLLHEAVTPLRWALVAGAMAGALVVIRPGSGLFGAAVWFPICGSLAYAAFQVLTRRLAAQEDPFTTHFYTGLVGTVLVLPVLLASGTHLDAAWLAASRADRLLLLAVGGLGTLGHLLLILALGMAPTALLMPFSYTQIAVATGLGGWLGGRLPDGWAWLGMAIITACGATSAWLNLRRPAPDRPASALEADTVAD